MTSLLIPTRNRPDSLSQTLDFLNQFYPGTRILIGDRCSDANKRSNAAAINRCKRLTVDRRSYDEDAPLFDVLLDTLRNNSDELIIIGSDVDFPLMDELEVASSFLARRPDHIAAMGSTLRLKLHTTNVLAAGLEIARPILRNDASARIRDYGRWPFPTIHSVTRREMLIECLERARKLYVPEFFEFTAGAHYCLQGKIHAIPNFTFIATETYPHSLRHPQDPMVLLQRSKDILKIVDQIRVDLMENSGLDSESAQQQAVSLIRSHMAKIVGRPAYKMRRFKDSDVYRNSIVQAQLKLFDDVFTLGNNARDNYCDRIRFIVTAMQNLETTTNKTTGNTSEDPSWAIFGSETKGTVSP